MHTRQLWLGSLAALVLGACTQSYDDFGFSGATTPTGGAGAVGGSGGTGGTGATGGSGGSGGSGATGGSGGSGATGGSGGSGGSCDFTAPNDCSTAQELTSISGHDGADTRSESGIGSMWYLVFVSETMGYPGDPLSYTASLTSPAGMDYDLFVYEGETDAPNDAQPNCSAAAEQGSGSPEEVTSQWSETQGANNDGRWVSIEVRYVSGVSCDLGSTWALTVTGNTQ